jgi:hypothetical protein
MAIQGEQRTEVPIKDEAQHGQDSRKKPRSNAATGASAAGMRAVMAQVISFYFRAAVKASFRTRVEYVY